MLEPSLRDGITPRSADNPGAGCPSTLRSMHLGRAMSAVVGAAAVMMALGSGCSRTDDSPCDDGIEHRMSVCTRS